MEPGEFEKPKIIEIHCRSSEIQFFKDHRWAFPFIKNNCFFFQIANFPTKSLVFWESQNFKELDISYYWSEFNNFWFFWNFRFQRAQKRSFVGKLELFFQGLIFEISCPAPRPIWFGLPANRPLHLKFKRMKNCRKSFVTKKSEKDMNL